MAACHCYLWTKGDRIIKEDHFGSILGFEHLVNAKLSSMGVGASMHWMN
jgi:hypothetical protein